MKITTFACTVGYIVAGATLLFLGFLRSYTDMPDPIHHDYVWSGEDHRYNVFCAVDGQQIGLVEQQGWDTDDSWRAYYNWEPVGDYIDKSHAEEAIEKMINKSGVCEER